ncbi:MAG: potassium-transporting ATPase subunit KdpA [Candidatus Aureabacteria bacterium]|nr:potassium-transporting ATPase subunit KdpA [Candidatus Auribacterota bacterium]
MKIMDIVQISLYFGILGILTLLLGSYIFRVLGKDRQGALDSFSRMDNAILRLVVGGRGTYEMTWKEYAFSLLVFNGIGFFALVLLQLFQAGLPLNPQKLPDVPFWLAFNTAVSFMTNTNWQAYSGEAVMSYLTQMLGLCVQNFLSAATGMGVLLALARGLKRQSAKTVGNFWVDVTRTTLYVLLPLSIILAVLLVSQGVVQSLAPYATVKTVEGGSQVIPLGPAASQIAIKQLGTNGGGFFGVNSAHPFENPTPFSNFLEMLAILLIPAVSVYMFGLMVGSRRHGACLFAAMLAILLAGFIVAWWSETRVNPMIGSPCWMEGKEIRFGVMNSVLWGCVTTGASNGSVNAMHDSMSPLTGMIPMCNMMMGEIIFGGVGTGLYTMILYVILTVFLTGIMVGRTPEYLGKKIEAREMIWAIIGILLPSAVILVGSAMACLLPAARSSVANGGPHGLSEILYAFTSATENNGSAFTGLNANTVFYNLALSVAMLIGRFGVIIPVLAIAGLLVSKKAAPPSSGTFPTTGVAFVFVLIGVILIVGALTFVPPLFLGPVVEHGLMLRGITF